MQHSAEWFRGRKEGLRALKDRIGAKRNTMLATWGSYTATDVEAIINEELDLLAEAEAREAEYQQAAESSQDPVGEAIMPVSEGSVPTATDLAVADELDMLSAHIQENIGPDDARDDIRRICRNRAQDLRRGVKRVPSAAEVIAACERALLQVGQWDAFTQREKGLMKDALALIGDWKEAHNA